MASKKKQIKKLRKDLAAEQARHNEVIKERNDIWDQYDAFRWWMQDHAPATLRRYGKPLPKNRPKTMDQIMRYYYAPAIRKAINEPTIFSVSKTP